MKNFKFKRAVIFLAATVGTCLVAFSFGNKPTQGGGTPSDLELCEDKYKDSNVPFMISELHLKYDLNTCSRADEFDLTELSNAHGDFDSKKGDIRYLSQIVQAYDAMYDNNRKPQCKVVFTGTDCSGDITRNYTSSEDVMGNSVSRIPDMGPQLKSMTFEIKTIKTVAHGIQLSWSASFDFKQTIGYLVLSDDATISYTISCLILVGYSKYIIPVRPYKYENNITIYSPVSNCVQDVTFAEDGKYVLSEHELYVSPALDKFVYSDGKEQEGLVWNKPVVIESLTPKK